MEGQEPDAAVGVEKLQTPVETRRYWEIRMTRLLAVLIALTLGLSGLGCDAEKESKPSTKPAATQSRSDLIDINRASTDELMALKGIGEVRAKAIIRGRPYSRKDELVQKRIVPKSVYDGFKEQIIAKQN